MHHARRWNRKLHMSYVASLQELRFCWNASFILLTKIQSADIMVERVEYGFESRSFSCNLRQRLWKVTCVNPHLFICLGKSSVMHGTSDHLVKNEQMRASRNVEWSHFDNSSVHLKLWVLRSWQHMIPRPRVDKSWQALLSATLVSNVKPPSSNTKR